jgi:uncharacterized protein with NRDE domain
MCLILVVWRQHARFPVFIAANRDEYHARATAYADWWPDAPDILAGRDLAAGGTWLGVTRSGRFAALTNFRDPARVRREAPSRGDLVTKLLQSDEPVAASLRWLQRVGGDYNGFNVLFSDGKDLAIYESVPGEARELAAGVYGLSNHLLDTPWPKVARAKSKLLLAIDAGRDQNAALALLRDSKPAPQEELPSTGVSLEWESLLSSAFIKAPHYGTRCSTIVRMDTNAHCFFDEWSWDAVGQETHRVSMNFFTRAPTTDPR